MRSSFWKSSQEIIDEGRKAQGIIPLITGAITPPKTIGWVLRVVIMTRLSQISRDQEGLITDESELISPTFYLEESVWEWIVA